MAAEPRGGDRVEVLIFLGVLAAWIVLQAWIMPKMGVGS